MSRESDVGWARLLPGVAMFRVYRIGWLRTDVIAGLTVGAMLIPQSMAYAELAGLPPQSGFYAVIGALIVYALVGSSRHLGVGPEPGTAILAATGVGGLAEGDPERYAELMAGLALVIAAICVVAWLARLGFLASVLSRPVLVGYITGVGLTLLSSQIATFTGVTIPSDAFFPRMRDLVTHIDHVDGPTVVLAAATLTGILALKWFAPRVPGALVAVVATTIIVAAFELKGHGILVVGEIPRGLPTPRIPEIPVADVGRLLPIAAGVALVGYSDNMLTSRAIASSRGYRIDANQELLALGLTNVSSGLSHGLPVSSSASRTAVPAALGSTTQLVSLVASAFVVVTLVAARSLLAEIPRAALAAVIVSAALAIIDVAGYRTLWTVSREEFVLAVVAALGVLVFDVLIGVLFAVSLSVVVALFHIARPHDAILGDYPGREGWVDAEAYPEAITEPGLVVYRFDAPLVFINAERFRERIEHALSDNPGVEQWVVLDFEGVGALDATGISMIEELLGSLGEHSVEVVAIARANDQVLGRLERAHVIEPRGSVRVFPTINSAVRAYRER